MLSIQWTQDKDKVGTRVSYTVCKCSLNEFLLFTFIIFLQVTYENNMYNILICRQH